MEIVLLVVALASVATNMYLVRRLLTSPEAVTLTVEVIEPEEILPEIEEWQKAPAGVLEAEAVYGPSPPNPVVAASDTNQAWQNRKGIPLNEMYSSQSPPPPLQKEEVGPRERPRYGWV